jgi:hypothetical protein
MGETASIFCQVRLETGAKADGNPDVNSPCLIEEILLIGPCATVSFLPEIAPLFRVPAAR